MNTTLSVLNRSLKALAFAALALALSQCAAVNKSNSSLDFDPPTKPVKNPANVRVKISTSAQRVYVMEGSEVLLATPCCVGPDGTSAATPKGNFTIYSKVANRRRVSSPGAGYPMTFWMEFKSAYGMHWGWVHPTPKTHGCVRLPIKSAQKIFSMVRTGTPLNIAVSQPEDATIGKTLPVLNDSTLADPPDSYMMSSKVFEDAAKGKMYY